MQEEDFYSLSNFAFDKIVQTIESKDTDGIIDIDFYGDIVNINIGYSTLVINKQSASKEIWLASTISGPHHFCYNMGEWQTKNGNKLFDILTKELGIPF